jgi:hypothetical protein
MPEEKAGSSSKAMYAHGDINTGDKVIKAGEKVSKADLGGSDEAWQQAIDSGAIGEEEDFEHAPVSGSVASTVEAAERDAQEQAVLAEPGSVRAKSRT